MFNEADRDLHRKKRKTVGPAISERVMRFFEPEMSQEVQVFLELLLLKSSQKNEVVGMTPRCERLGVDVVGRLAFGFELKSQREPTHRHVAEGIKARSAISSVCMSWPGLRILNPVVTLLSPRHHKTDKVNGHVIPQSTEVSINAYSFMRNPEYYLEPLAFRPERWLAEENDEQRRAFVPFSLGSHSCAGHTMAYLELSLALARTLWYFDFEKAPGEAGKLGEVPGAPGEFKLEDSTIVGHHDLNLLFKARDEHWKDLLDEKKQASLDAEVAASTKS